MREYTFEKHLFYYILKASIKIMRMAKALVFLVEFRFIFILFFYAEKLPDNVNNTAAVIGNRLFCY
jgi:hypothetical protein